MTETITPENQAYIDRVDAKKAAEDAENVRRILDEYPDASADDLRAFAQGERDRAQRTIDRYGEGVRPSWVSTDVALAYDSARKFDLAATQKEVAA